MKDYSIGQLLDIIFSYQNLMSEDTDDNEMISRNEVLKNNAVFVEEMYKNGEISKEEYEEFINALEV